MAEPIRRGQNTTIASNAYGAGIANRNFSTSVYPRSTGTTRRAMVWLPMTEILGRTIVSATLSPRVRGATPAQLFTVQAIAGKWAVDKVTWNSQPAVRSLTASINPGALADGARFSINITALVQQSANGLPHYGWMITSAGDAQYYGFASTDSWVLTVETSDAPNAPTTLVPDAGVIGLAKWVCRTDFTDLGGSTDQASINVQVDPEAAAPIAWDSGEVATTVPVLDLATTSYPGLANGATTRWRVRVKDTDGIWSPWSTWATVTRVIKPALVIDSPTGGVLSDPTPIVQAHIDSGTIKSWSVLVAEGADRTRVRYDSGRRPGVGTATFITELPLRNPDGDVVFRDDQPHQTRVRVSDRLDRVQGGPDDPPYIEQWITVAFDDDATITAPTSLTATNPEGTPSVLLTWARPGSADAWMIKRDNAIIARLEPGEVIASAGTYSWTDSGASPNETHTWAVYPIVNKVIGAARSVTAQSVVKGLWLLSVHGDVVLDGTGVGQLRKQDRRATYKLPNRPDDVDIIGAFEGLAGPYEGSIQLTHYRRTEAVLDGARDILKAIRRDPTTPVRLVYGTTSVPVLLRNLSVTVGEEFQVNTRQHAVSFECWQVGEF